MRKVDKPKAPSSTYPEREITTAEVPAKTNQIDVVDVDWLRQ